MAGGRKRVRKAAAEEPVAPRAPVDPAVARFLDALARVLVADVLDGAEEAEPDEAD